MTLFQKSGVSEEQIYLQKDMELFDVFMAGMPKHAQILDLGCRPGIPIAKKLVETGFAVTGVDRSEKLLRKAMGNIPNGNFIRFDIEDFSIEGKYDGVVLWDSIFHLPHEVHEKLLERIFGAL